MEKSSPIKQSFILILFFLILLDQFTKYFLENYLIVGLNKGISFGFFSSVPHFFISLFLLIIFILIALILRKRFINTFYFYLFAAGSISNLIDRFYFGGVRDWITLPFVNLRNNLADFYIILGLLGIFLLQIQHDGKN